MIFNKWYNDYKELKLEHEYYARECFRKEENIRKLKKEIKELNEKIEKLENKRRPGRPRKEGNND